MLDDRGSRGAKYERHSGAGRHQHDGVTDRRLSRRR